MNVIKVKNIDDVLHYLFNQWDWFEGYINKKYNKAKAKSLFKIFINAEVIYDKKYTFLDEY